jgi:predicted small lipoprotein YifL
MTRILLFAVILALAGAACGKKGNLIPPEAAAPKTITNLTARSAPNGVVLTWSRPTEYVSGATLKDLASFVIFRKEVSASCPDCPVPYRQLTTVNVEDRQRFSQQKQYRYDDQEVQPKTIYRYRIASQLLDGSLSAPSNEVEVVR